MARGSASKVSRIRRCKHALYYSDMLDLERVAQSIAPAKGSLIHACLQNHYSGKDWTKPIETLKIEFDKLFDEEREEWGDLPKELYRIVRGYLLSYKDADSRIKTLATEVHFEIPLNDHIYEGYIDWIYEDDRGVWVVDHKCVKTLPSEQDLYMDLQTLMYYEACRTDPNLVKLLKGKKLAGVVFNHIRTKSPREPQLLKSGGLSKAAIDTDVATYFETVKKNGLNPKDYEDMLEKLRNNVFFRRTKIPVSEATISILKNEIIASLDEYDRYKKLFNNRGESCKWMFPRTLLKQRCSWDCEFSQLCFSELAGMNIQGIIDEKFQKRSKREEEEIDG